jgi:hypothetical protein
MKLECLLPHLQEPSTRLYPKPDQELTFSNGIF